MMMDSEAEGWSLRRAFGGLHEDVKRLIEGQQKLEDRLEQGLKENNDRLERGLKENNERLDSSIDRLELLDRKFDRLLYAVIGFGTAITALLIMEIVRGG